MTFASPVFLFLFLPLFLGVYYAAAAKHRTAVILAASTVFYGWWRVDFLLLLYALAGISFIVAGQIEKHRGTEKSRRLLYLGVGANLLSLFYFKYWNFGVSTLAPVFLPAGNMPPPEMIAVILPVGISFFVFHAISYIVDVWRGDAEPAKSFTVFAAFMMFFPHLVAGPVLRYKDLAKQFARRSGAFSRAAFEEGACRFMAGFAKKILIADTVAPLADAAFALESPSLAESWLGLVAYTVQLYFDFSGYSDMAIGLARMTGFRFAENFSLPYFSRSLRDFWRRWHISLSNFLRDYLYIPLGGSRARAARNLFATMVLGGLWHGASLNFLAWGAWHGGWLALERKFGISSRALTLFTVLMGWVFFRAADLPAALAFYKGLAGMQGLSFGDIFTAGFRRLPLIALIAGLSFGALEPLLARYGKSITLPGGGIARKVALPVALRAAVAALFLLAVTRLLAMNATPFLYFRF